MSKDLDITSDIRHSVRCKDCKNNAFEIIYVGRKNVKYFSCSECGKIHKTKRDFEVVSE